MQNENLARNSNIVVYGVCTIPNTLPQIGHVSRAVKFGGAKSSIWLTCQLIIYLDILALLLGELLSALYGPI